MKDVLPGLKTKINGWVMALIPIASMMGYEFDPEATKEFMEQFWGWLAAGQVGLAALNVKFRNLANKNG